MIYWFMGHPGVGKDYCASKLSQLLSCPNIDADDHLTESNKQALINGTFTSEDRLDKIARICREIESLLENSTDITVADSLPDELSRKFVYNCLNGNVRFVHVVVPAELHRQRLRDRTDHFFTDDLVDDYIAKHWEPMGLPHKILHNNSDNEHELMKQLEQIVAGR